VRLRAGCGHREIALGIPSRIAGDATKILAVRDHPRGDRVDLLARTRERDEPLAAAHEHVEAELVLEQADVMADAGLRRVKRTASVTCMSWRTTSTR